LIDSKSASDADALNAKINFDTLDMCYKTNRFVMTDGTKYNNDAWKISRWRLFDDYKKMFVSKDSLRFRYTFDSISTNKLRYIVESQKGCRDTVDTLLVVYPYPLAKLAASSNYFCQNAEVTFTDSSQSKEGVGSSIWEFGNGAKDTALPYITKYKYTTEGSFKVRLITVTPFGCRDTVDSTFVVRPAPLNKIDIKQISLCFKTNEFDFTE